MWKIGEICDLKLRNTYDRLRIDGKLKEEHKHIAKVGLDRALELLKVFKF